jgi:hypothetical protein
VVVRHNYDIYGNYRMWLEQFIEIDLWTIAEHGFTFKERGDIPERFRLLPRFRELAPILGHNDALKQIVHEGIDFGRLGTSGIANICLQALFGLLEHQSGNLSYQERDDEARRIFTQDEKQYDDRWFNTKEKHYFPELAIAICDGIRQPPDEIEDTGEFPTLDELTAALNELVMVGLPITYKLANSKLTRLLLGHDFTKLAGSEIVAGIARLNSYLVEQINALDDKHARAARIYFCVEPGHKGSNITQRQEAIADIYGVTTRAVYGWRADIISQLAWNIYIDRVSPPPLRAENSS